MCFDSMSCVSLWGMGIFFFFFFGKELKKGLVHRGFCNEWHDLGVLHP